MKRVWLLVLNVCLFAIAYSQAGTLDPSFGKKGIVQTDFTNIASETALQAAVQTNGKMLVLFTARNESWLVRYLSNGNRDLDFTDYSRNFNTGFVRVSSNETFQAKALAVQNNGNILVAGTAPGDNSDFALLQRAPDGNLDESFGINGQVTTTLKAGTKDSATAVVIQPDGKIVVAGTMYTGTLSELAVVRYNSDGSLDKTFSFDGKATMAMSSGHAVAHSVLLQPDGKIVVGGTIGTTKKDFALTRFNADGSHDLSFSVDSKVYTDFASGDDVLTSLAVQDDGKLIAGGVTTKLNTNLALARYKQDGTLDSSFGLNGKLFTGYSNGTNMILQSVAVQNDGNIVTGGFIQTGAGETFLMIRFSPNGTIDSSFGVYGFQSINFGSAHAMANYMFLLPDDRIVMAGATGKDQTDLAVARFTASGQPDKTLKGNGKLVDYLKGSSTYYGMAVQPDGKILAGGFCTDYNTGGNHHDYALARYLINGQLDPSFGTGGRVTQHFNETYNSFITEVALQNDGKIVVAGTVPNGADHKNDFEVSRYTTQGILDSSFGTNGILFIDFGGSEDEANGLIIQPNGKIVVSGSARGGGQHSGIAIARCLPDGTLDKIFGAGGKKIIEAGETDGSGTGAESYDAALQPDGKIVLGGRAQQNGGSRQFLAVRLNPNGSLDKTFSNDGIQILNLEDDYWASVVTVAIQSDKKIVLVGYPNFTVARLNPNGTLDNTFSDDGWVRTSFDLGDEQSFGCALETDGKIIAAGSAGLAIALARYNPDGSLDNSFGDGGLQRTDISPGVDHFQLIRIYGNRLYGAGFTHRDYGDPQGPETGIATVGAYQLGLGPLTFYRDVDQDGYGDLKKFKTAVGQPFGYVLDHTDCNDANAAVHPGAPEMKDGLDNNCNGLIDENTSSNFVISTIKQQVAQPLALQARVYPNPSAQSFTLAIQSSYPGAISMRVFDAGGRLVEQRAGVSSSGIITIGMGYKPGIYYVEMVQGIEKRTIRLVKN